MGVGCAAGVRRRSLSTSPRRENPNLLPLDGSPRLMVLGSEVQLGNGYADILAIEPSGRPVIIEFKLASSREARREIVPQVLAYAASLQSMSDAFRDSFADVAGEVRDTFERLTEWAEQISSLPNVRLFTFAGIEGKRYTLLPRIMPDNTGLVTIWNDEQRPSIAVWRSVFDRLAPDSVEFVERAIAPTKFGQGNSVKNITPEVLETLKAAYEEAAKK